MSKYVKDLLERVLWTALQAGIGVATVEIADLDYVWVPIVATILAIAKGFVAKQIGNADSASTVGSV